MAPHTPNRNENHDGPHKSNTNRQNWLSVSQHPTQGGHAHHTCMFGVICIMLLVDLYVHGHVVCICVYSCASGGQKSTSAVFLPWTPSYVVRTDSCGFRLPVSPVNVGNPPVFPFSLLPSVMAPLCLAFFRDYGHPNSGPYILKAEQWLHLSTCSPATHQNPAYSLGYGFVLMWYIQNIKQNHHISSVSLYLESRTSLCSFIFFLDSGNKRWWLPIKSANHAR